METLIPLFFYPMLCLSPFSQKHSSVSDLSTYFSTSFSFLEHSITFYQPSGNASHLFTYIPDLWQCYITFPALSGNVTPRFRSLAMLHNVSSSLAMLHNVSDLWQSWLCALEVIKWFPCVMHEFRYFDASYEHSV